MLHYLSNIDLWIVFLKEHLLPPHIGRTEVEQPHVTSQHMWATNKWKLGLDSMLIHRRKAGRRGQGLS